MAERKLQKSARNGAWYAGSSRTQHVGKQVISAHSESNSELPQQSRKILHEKPCPIERMCENRRGRVFRHPPNRLMLQEWAVRQFWPATGHHAARRFGRTDTEISRSLPLREDP